jgi:hypothetical protein
MGPGEYRSSSDIFSPGTVAPDSEDDGPESVSLVTEVQAPSKNAISKTRTLVSAACLITDPNLFARYL